jgi:hypothetical protein
MGRVEDSEMLLAWLQASIVNNTDRLGRTMPDKVADSKWRSRTEPMIDMIKLALVPGSLN